MENYQVHLSINEYNDRNSKYEFHWMGEDLRFDLQELDLIIEGDSEEDVHDIVLAQSKGTLRILGIAKAGDAVLEELEKEDEAEEFYRELVTPLRNTDIMAIAGNNPATISNN